MCDGLGPTFALRPMSSERLATWPLSLPDRGTLGIYVRARGRVGGLLIGVWGGNSEPFPMPTGTANPQTELGNYVVRDLQSWDSPQMAPDTLALGFSAMNDIVVEIDCVVPFLE